MNSVRKLLELIKPFNKFINQIYVLAILQGVFYLMVPLGIQAIVTYTMAGEMSSSLILLCSLTIASVLFIGIFQLWQIRITETIQQSILVYVSVRFSEKIQKLTKDEFLQTYMPSKLNQFFDVLSLQKGVSKILLDVTFAIISIVFGLVILSAYSSSFLIFTFTTVAVFYFIIKVFGLKAMETSLNESKSKYQFVDWLHKMFIGLKEENPKYTSEYITNATENNLQKYINYKTSHFKILDVQFRSILIFKVIFTAFLLIIGVFFVQMGLLNIGQFVASEIIVILIINSVEKLVISLETVYDVLTSVEKLYQVFDLEENEDSSITKDNKSLYKFLMDKIYKHEYGTKTKKLIYVALLLGVIVLFSPWTQTINCNGYVSTLNPTERPQAIQSRISGRIERWFVKEGDYLKKGDTIAYISEIKEDYFDPNLINRTSQQVTSKESAIKSYQEKINSIDQQIDAINQTLKLKMEQLLNKITQSKNKIESDSIDYITAKNNYTISDDQFKRYEELLTKGVISKTDYENRKAKLQDGVAKKVSSENKWRNSKNELLNSFIELNSAKQEYNEKLMKAESDKFSALSLLYDAEIGLTKMQNQLTNYTIRNNYYYVTAPQDGFVTKSYVLGVGEIVKESESLISFVPEQKTFSVELYVEPMDLPLVYKGMDIQLTFDGWPAFVFSGWPGLSFGTYHAKVVSVDKVISENGKFRVLAIEERHDWPISTQVGTGVQGLVLLKSVPVIFEMWRKLNGFPPEFYDQKNIKKESDSKEKKDGKKEKKK
jgi:multidrug resistance efflux pump